MKGRNNEKNLTTIYFLTVFGYVVVLMLAILLIALFSNTTHKVETVPIYMEEVIKI